jgi:hypothetical protein
MFRHMKFLLCLRSHYVPIYVVPILFCSMLQDGPGYSTRDHSHHRSPESQRKRLRTEHGYVQVQSQGLDLVSSQNLSSDGVS